MEADEDPRDVLRDLNFHLLALEQAKELKRHMSLSYDFCPKVLWNCIPKMPLRPWS